MDFEICRLPDSEYHGCTQENFLLCGRNGILVRPQNPRKGNPWVWRAEFFDAFPSVDLLLLERGYHIAYYGLSDLYGAPQAINGMKLFYDYLTQKKALSARAELFGFSRGGMYAVNFAARFPEAVNTLYLDAPVLDMKSWPAGWGKGCGGKTEWEQCKAVYSLTDETARTFKENPIDRVPELLKHRIPVALVSGDSDQTVPYEENGARLAALYQGAKLLLIIKPGADHHPHSLEEPAPIADFILSHAPQA